MPSDGRRRGATPGCRRTSPPSRRRTLDLVAHLPTADLERLIDPIMSPLVWDLGHIAAYEDLWSCTATTRAPAAAARRTSPRSTTPSRRRAPCAATSSSSTTPARWPTSTRCASARSTCSSARGAGDGFVHEMVLRHELQHTETMRQAMATRPACCRAGEPAPPAPTPRAGGRRGSRVPGGTHALGAARRRLRLRQRAPAPRRRRPAPSASPAARSPTRRWLHVRRGRRLRPPRVVVRRGLGVEGGVRHHPPRRRGGGRAGRARCHVSWFEADAFARAHDARLPTEAEWEKAATSDQLDGSGACGSGPRREFPGYPGFAAHPYREYSEVFFDRGYRVLRGGSWATAPARRDRAPSATGTSPSAGRSSPASASPALRRTDPMEPTARRRSGSSSRPRSRPARAARWPTTCSTASPARSRSCRPSTSTTPAARSSSTGSASSPSTTRRAPSARSSRRAPATSRRSPARPSSSSWARAPRPRRASCCARCDDAGTLRRYVPFDVTEAHGPRRAPPSSSRVHPGLLVHGIVGDFERHLGELPPRLDAGHGAHRRVPGRHDRQLHRPARAAASCARCAGALDADDVLLLGTDLVKDPAIIEAAYDDAAGRHRGVQPQRAARRQPRARRRLRPRRLRARRVLRPRARVDRDAPARRSAACDVRVGALDLRGDASRRARSCARRSARSSPASAWRATWRPPGWSSLEVLTDPDELFALSLSRPRRVRAEPCSRPRPRLPTAVQEPMDAATTRRLLRELRGLRRPARRGGPRRRAADARRRPRRASSALDQAHLLLFQPGGSTIWGTVVAPRRRRRVRAAPPATAGRPWAGSPRRGARWSSPAPLRRMLPGDARRDVHGLDTASCCRCVAGERPARRRRRRAAATPRPWSEARGRGRRRAGRRRRRADRRRRRPPRRARSTRSPAA